MGKFQLMKIKKGDIEIEVQGNCEDVKEQFVKAVETVKEIHQLKTEQEKEAYDQVSEKLLGPIMAMLK